jgi:hypothetical protein
MCVTVFWNKGRRDGHQCRSGVSSHSPLVADQGKGTSPIGPLKAASDDIRQARQTQRSKQIVVVKSRLRSCIFLNRRFQDSTNKACGSRILISNQSTTVRASYRCVTSRQCCVAKGSQISDSQAASGIAEQALGPFGAHKFLAEPQTKNLGVHASGRRCT